MRDSSVDFRILGPLEVLCGDHLAALKSRKQRTILAALLARVGEVVSVDALMDALWPADPPATGVKTLRFHVSKLRAALGEQCPEVAKLIVTVPPGYRLDTAPAQTDVGRFEHGVREARRVAELAPAEAAAKLDRALAEWRGAAFAEFAFDEFAQGEIRRLTELRMTATIARIGAALASGRDGPELIGELESLVASYPTHEAAWAYLMHAYYRAGRHRDAISAFERARVLLADAGLEPSHQLRHMQARVLGDDPTLRGPAVRASDGLPAATVALVGRSALVDEVLGMVAERRLITLAGPGGVGKTSVALELAHRVAALGDLRVGWVELVPARDANDLIDRIATRLAVAERPVVSTLESIAVDTQKSRAVVFLDNCEHLLPNVATEVAEIVRACPGLTVIATSREVLRVHGERVVWVPPLPIDADETADEGAAVKLLKARVSDLGLGVTDADRDDLADICRALDGMPLAIELAAARLRAMTPTELGERLHDRFRLLTGDTRGGPDRHASLEATVRWSYDHLDDAEQVLLGRLSVFTGAFTFDAVERVCGFSTVEGPAILHLLGELVAKSVVNRDATAEVGGFRLLQTIQLWARTAMEARGERHELADRHAAYCAAQLDAFLARESVDLAHVLTLADDVQQAVDHLIETDQVDRAIELLSAGFKVLGPVGLRQHRDFAFDAFEQLLPRLSEVEPERRADALHGGGTAALVRGEAQAVDLLEAAYREFRAKGDCGCIVVTTLGAAYSRQGRSEDAIEAYARSDRSPHPHNCGWKGRSARAQLNRVMALIDIGRAADAREVLVRIAAGQARGEVDNDGWLELGWAELHRSEGDLAKGQEVLESAASAIADTPEGESYTSAWIDANLARVHLDLADHENCGATLERSLRSFRRLHSIDDVFDALAVAARLLEAAGRWEHAATLLGAIAAWEPSAGALRSDTMALIDRESARSRSPLADRSFDRAWNRHVRASVDDLLDVALEMIT